MSRSKWQGKASARARKIVAAQLPAPCIRCGRTVTPEMRWDADHIVSRYEAQQLGWSQTEMDSASNLGVAHASCNRSHGGRLAHKARQARAEQPPTIEQPNRPVFRDTSRVPGLGLLTFSLPSQEAGE